MSSTAKKTETTLQTGDKAPEFSVTADDGQCISLADLKGKNAVIYFYPKDDTPGCTQESKDFRDLNGAFAAADTVVIGVSKDSVKSHVKFKEKYELPFALLADETCEMCEAYGVWKEKSMYGKKYMGIERSTFLIDAEGKLRSVWPKVKVTDHAQEVLEAAQSL